MKKHFSLAAAFIITLFVLPFGNTVLADGESYEDIKDGEYNITAKALNADTYEASGAAGFINEKAVLSVQDGAFKLTITIPHNDMAEITSLQIEGAEPTINGDAWTYDLSNLKSELNAQVSYEVPSIEMVHDDLPFRFILEGLDDLPKADDNTGDEDTDSNEDGSGEDSTDGEENDSENGNDSNDGNEQDESEENGDTNTDGSDDGKVEEGIKNPDKTYETEFITDSSATQNQFNNPVTLLIKDGKQYIQMSGTGGQFIKSLTVNGTEVTWLEKNDDGTFLIQFALPGALSDEIDFGMVISPPGMDDMEHMVPLSFKDINSEDPKENPEKDDPKKDDPKNDNKQKPKKEPKAKDLSTPDKAYEIDYTIKHATNDEVSAADSFFQKPGILLEKDGKRYLQLTVNSWEWIQYIKTKHGDVDVVKLNKDGSAVIQFKVDGNLNDPIMLDMHIIVPKEVAGMDYDMKHSARLFLDSNSMKEIDASDFEVIVDQTKKNDNNINDNNDNGQGSGNNNKTPTKPTFGINSDSTDNGATPMKGNNSDNPKTGDTMHILPLSLLLIGSLIPLAIKARRRFV